MSEISEVIANEIADFFAGFGGPGEPDIQNGEAQRLLTERLLSVLALREKTRRAVAYLKAVNDRSDPEFKDVLVDYAIRELDGNDHPSAQPALVVPKIDRKAICNKAHWLCARSPGATFYNAAEFALDEVMELLAPPAPVAAEPVSPPYKLPDGWIACSERMPELDTRVLLYFPDYGGHIEDGCIGDEGDGHYHYFFDGDSLRHEPTHWMPLPEAPATN
ncbi:DUF551 domain-containing protein [Cronobacter sakazakii]|uniref:DUF551 domain-containing protein n=1 Tax=Cronobacter sakazakii TaxID=28141 RepID=UPI0018F87A0B|nr:DUF551 domain-containing protein [Cronobacter sakazakii]